MPAKDFRTFHNIRLIVGLREPRGVLPDIETLAYRLRLSLKQTGELLDRLIALGLIERFDGGVLMPRRWDDEQFIADDVTARTQKHREKKRMESRNSTQTKRSGERSQPVPRNVREQNRLDGEEIETRKDGDRDFRTDRRSVRPPLNFSTHENGVGNEHVPPSAARADFSPSGPNPYPVEVEEPLPNGTLMSPSWVPDMALVRAACDRWPEQDVMSLTKLFRDEAVASRRRSDNWPREWGQALADELGLPNERTGT